MAHAVSEPARATRHAGLFAALLVMLAWAPIPIGSNREWSSALLAAGFLLVSAGWFLSCVWRPFPLPDALRTMRVPLILLVLWAAYPLLQLMPLPSAAAAALGGEAQNFYALLPGQGAQGHAYLSVDRGATFSGLIRQSSQVAVFASVVALVVTPRRLFALMAVLTAVGFAQALYGLVLYFGGGELGMWSPGQAADTVSGTYVNQNHFAGMMEVAIPAACGLLMSDRSEQAFIAGPRDITRYVSELLLSQRGLILFSVLIMSGALILTTSRGGIGSLAIGIAAAAAIAVWKKGVRARELRVGVIAVALALIAVSWLGSGQFSEKLKSAGLASNRADQREIGYRIIEDNLSTGTGLGSYRWVFSAYKDERFGGYFYEHAHNDYLEILAEQGIIGFVLVASAVVLVMARNARAFVRRRDSLARGALFASMAGCVSLMVHGLVDFNFQIPANAAFYFVLLAMGVAASEICRNAEERPSAEAVPSGSP